VQGAERIGSGLLGSLFLLWGVRREGPVGLAAMAGGLGLLARAATGRCAIKRALEPTPYASEIARTRGWPAAQVTSAAVTVGRPRAEVYALWRDFANLPRFMKHVQSIEVLTPHRSRWTVKAPLGKTVSWTSFVTEEIENERIAWESEAGAEVPNYGWVELRDAPGDRGTEISALIAYRPPFGSAGRLMSAVLRETPEHQMRDDLRRLKQILETGEVAASQAQPL
jgi:uncharacterized membrane protein